MIVTPGISNLTYKIENGVKCFELIAQPVKQEILSGIYINALGYNGSTPGPTIIVCPGDYVRIRVINQLNEPTSVHWHGIDLPNNMDGVPDVEPSPAISSGSYFDYHFQIVNPPGTHLYHSHVNTIRQDMLGLVGAFIIEDPHEKYSYGLRDYFFMLQEFALIGLPKEIVKPGTYDVNPKSDMFNFFTINGRCFPYTTPVPARCGEFIRIRLGSIGMQVHPMHLHGQQFYVIATDGNTLAPYHCYLKNTIPVASGETYDLFFQANNLGNWPFHCHIPHHLSNNFTDSLGGMFTVIQTKC